MDLNKSKLKDNIDHVIKIIDHNLERFTYKFPSTASTNLKYDDIENNAWTTSFWTGMLWLAYEYTHDSKYFDVIQIHLESFKKRIYLKGKDVQNHDIGFLYSLSWVPYHRKFQDEASKEVILEAADFLITRYHPKAQIIQAWGDLTDPKHRGRLIIDCNMNLALLYYASEISGNPKYHDIAVNHVLQAAKYIIRDDFSTYHTYYMDVETGEGLYGTTHQGYNDNSCWSRGQAWAIYGFTLSYKYTNNQDLIDLVKPIAKYYREHLPSDLICNWDLCFTDDSTQKDASASAIAACGLLEFIKYLPDVDIDKQKIEQLVLNTYHTLSKHYVGNDLNGVLLHSVYNMNKGWGVDEYCSWGDYFYFELLIRLFKQWEIYW